ncbi:MAG TPA: TetR/AcrR family transcriptional regulator [Sporichthyaceae bacterium]|nr:TetR/AcrR family transcriptional regulator [Sporichthyaceae bacterium]
MSETARVDADTGSRTSRAEAQRVRIVAVAIDMFSRQGFRATSMNEIAAAVGLSKPTLYHYFASKEMLLVHIYTAVLDESLDDGRRVIAAAPDPLSAIRDLIAARVVYTCRNSALLKVCFEEEHELPADLQPALLIRRRAFEDLFTDTVNAHLTVHPEALGGVAPKVWVNTCLGAINWCYKWYRPSGPAGPAELGAQIATSLTAGLRA